MHQLLCLFSIIVSLPVFSQTKLEAIQDILEFNGSSVLQHFSDGETSVLNEQLLLTEAWALVGNDYKTELYANKARKRSLYESTAVQAYFEARLLLSQYKDDEATKIFSFLDYEKLSLLQQAFLLNHSIENGLSTPKIEEQLEALSNQLGRDMPLIHILQAKAKVASENYDIAIRILSNLLSHNSPYVQVKVCLELGKARIKQNNLATALADLKKGLDLAVEIKHHKAIAEICYQMSLTYARSGNFDAAIPLISIGTSSSRLIGNKMLEYRLNNILDWSYFSTGASFSKSLELEARQFELAKKIRQEQVIADVYNNLGYNLTVSGTASLDSTSQLMKRANGIYAKSENTDGRWYTLMNLVWQHRLMGDYKSSAKYGIQSVQQARSINDRHAIIESAFQLGETYIALGQIDEAAKYYDEAKKWAGTEMDRDRYVNDVYLAHFLWESGENKLEVIKMLEGAISFLKKGEVFYEMQARALLAKYYFRLGQKDLSIEQLAIFEKPRSNYIAFESRILASLTKSEILIQDGQVLKAKALLNSYLIQATQINAKMLESEILKALKLAGN